jgi:hypothetical protein
VRRFDVVAALDVLEHVEDVDATLDMCAAALEPGGVFGFLTHSQTLEAFEELIWQGGYQIGFIPKGNHDFHKFLDPDDLAQRLAARGLRLIETRGIWFDGVPPVSWALDRWAVRPGGEDRCPCIHPAVSRAVPARRGRVGALVGGVDPRAGQGAGGLARAGRGCAARADTPSRRARSRCASGSSRPSSTRVSAATA